MYISELTIKNFRCFDENGVTVKLQKGLTALVGENDSGKTAIIDAIRYVLGTTDNDRNRVDYSDFYKEDLSKEILIVLKFEDLNTSEQAAFLEYLTYVEIDGNFHPELYINYTSTQSKSSGREYFQTTVNSGKNFDGPKLEESAKVLLRATYLQPLRDAERAMSPGKNSRLSQILKNISGINSGISYGDEVDIKTLSISGILELADELLSLNNGVKSAQNDINNVLINKLLLANSGIESSIKVFSENMTPDRKLTSMLEKLNLGVNRASDDYGRLGLGTNNLLYMACELLLLNQGKTGYNLLLIEEPEAHIHAQRQMKIMKSLQEDSEKDGIQIILSTHSPQLASSIKLSNLVYVQKSNIFSMGAGYTDLSKSDYRFLERFLDSTKANLFFARGVVIVEGDAENILLPTIAKLLNRDFADYGVSIVNVGGVGLRRYARIFQRKNETDDEKYISVPVACLTDADIMPDCAPAICKKDEYSDKTKWPSNRKWQVTSEVEDIDEHKNKIKSKCDGQNVKTFVSDKWTFEYHLAYFGLGKEVYVAAYCALNEEDTFEPTKTIKNIISDGCEKHKEYVEVIADDEEKCSQIYSLYTRKNASKPISAQYLAEFLNHFYKDNSKALYDKLPPYVINAIEYATEKISFEQFAEDREEG